MYNPYANATVAITPEGSPIQDFKVNGQALVSQSGEFNAYDNKGLLLAIDNLMKAVSSGQLVKTTLDENGQPVKPEVLKRERMEALAAAYQDPEAWMSLGSDIAIKIQEQRAREGFMRRLCVGQDLRQGEIPRVAMERHDAKAVTVNSSGSLGYQIYREREFFPQEYEINAHIRVSRLEMERSNEDMLQNIYQQGLEAIMVHEDRIWKQAADMTVGLVNPIEYISGELTPRIMASLRESVDSWNLTAQNCLIGSGFWKDIIGNDEWHSFLDPVTKYDLALNGKIATLIGMAIHTDGFRNKNLRVLDRNEIYVVADPEYHAAFTDRGGIVVNQAVGVNQGDSSKGWFFNTIESFTLANVRSVAKGVAVNR